ncbi:MAG: leucine-rich repeat domain-containing protein [Prevotellaceae bacterium]|jgi:Leucine-rich repeat (LRR) protein|nr:leucine-rich repeat domain-containing protein [Prevotellaceae bacterium]
MKKSFLLLAFACVTSLYAQENICCENIPDYDVIIDLDEALSKKESIVSLDISQQSPKLTKAPEALVQLPNLKCLNLSYNRLSAFPENFKELQNLTCLDLSGNHYLQKLPDFFNEMPNLKVVKIKELSWSAAKKKEIEEKFPNIKFEW